jgi:hypothetical protein
MFGGDARFVVVEPDGNVSATHDVPNANFASRVALCERWALVTAFGNTCQLLNLADGTWHSFAVPGASEESSWGFGFSADGSELWAANARDARLKRYRLPN